MAAFLADGPLRSGRRWRMLPIRASGQPAFGKYLWDPARETFRAHGITVLTLDGAGVGEITNFLDVAPPDIGKASGTFSTMRQLGGAFGVAVLVAVFTSAGSYASAQEFSDGFVAASVACAGLALVGVLAAGALPRRGTARERAEANAVPALETEGR